MTLTMDQEGDLVTRMRAEDAEQFYTLVRMHLSFVLDLNSEDCEVNAERKSRPMKWNLPFSKKVKGSSKPHEGSQLTPELVSQMNILIEFLRKPDALVQEGIFRRTGKLKRQQDLKAKLSANEPVDLESGEYSVHDCASVIKTYLSELPEPLLTEAHYPAYCQVSQLNGNEERLLLALQLLIQLLPLENHSFLQQVFSLLHLVAEHVESNKMSTTNLATLFTPHLLWPRRAAVEALQANSHALTGVVAFMIEQSDKLFIVPDALATDIRVYWEKKARRRRSPRLLLNESVCDGTTANTVFTFVDRERTAQENGSNPTELALAQLYAHIQSLPDSARKRRLVKNFNKKNGQGTPAIREDRHKHRRSRSLRDSIKKHIGFGKNGKSSDSPSSNDSTSPEPIMKTPLLPPNISKLRRRPQMKQDLLPKTPFRASKENRDPLESLSRSRSCEVLSPKPMKAQKRPSPSSDCPPAKKPTPPKQDHPIVVTPSLIIPTRKPSVTRAAALLSAIQPASPPKESGFAQVHWTSPRREMARSPPRRGRLDEMARSPPRFHTPISVSNLRMHEPGLPSVTNLLSSATPQRRRLPCTLTTSTPATSARGTGGCGLLTPQVERTSSMSPITRSTQRMPRAMQETMMTPRSRKPVVSLSGSDLCQLTSLEPWTPVEVEKRLILEESESSGKDSLSSTFRDYLISRSVLTASPVDLSFSSRTDDYQSASGKSTSLDDLRSLVDGPMSASLLYCMDGNDPDQKSPAPVPTPARSHICETAI